MDARWSVLTTGPWYGCKMVSSDRELPTQQTNNMTLKHSWSVVAHLRAASENT